MYPVYSTANRNQVFIPSLFNEFFNDNFSDRMMTRFTSSTPAVNVSEDAKEYKVEVAAPGMSKEDFKISLDGDNIVIVMEHKTNNDNADTSTSSAQATDEKKYIRKEFCYSKYQQTFTLPENIERQNITAQMTDGILTIDIPKKTEQEKVPEAQYIEIK